MINEIRQGSKDKVCGIVQNNNTYTKVYKGESLVFDINGNGKDGELTIFLTTNGTDIFVHPSRELKEDEHVCLLRCGTSKKRVEKNGGEIYYTKKRKWNVYFNTSYKDSKFPSYLEKNTNKFIIDKQITGRDFNELVKWEEYQRLVDGKEFYRIQKARSSWFTKPIVKGVTGKVCFGIGVYTYNGYRPGDKLQFPYKRISNIVYFRSNIITKTGEQWLSV